MSTPLLLPAYLSLTDPWRDVFPQQRTFVRAQRQALGSLLVVGRATLSRILCVNGRDQMSWSAEYFLHSRVKWEPQGLFQPILERALDFCPGRMIGVAVDDTRVHKTGRLIPQAAYHRDPLSPPFHTNLIWALRFLQASILLPLHRFGSYGARAIPIRFEEVSVVKKPGKRASVEAWEQYQGDRKQYNLSTHFVWSMAELRRSLDQAGAESNPLVVAGDGSFCNRTVFRGIPERTVLLVRARKDTSLCFPAEPGTRRVYGAGKFAPEQVRQDPNRKWKTTKIFYGGRRRTVRYKEVRGVLWQRGAKRQPLRLFVIAPTPYRKRKSSKMYYRDPAYLLCTDVTSTAHQLLQIYFDRWQIEVNHREEKDTLGVGEAQLWNPVSVPKQPALVVASYSALHLAGLQVFGAERGRQYVALPKWRRNAKRPSLQDLLTVLRKEVTAHPELVRHLGIITSAAQMVEKAVA